MALHGSCFSLEEGFICLIACQVFFFPAIALGLIKDITSPCSHGLLYSPYTANLVKEGLKGPCLVWCGAS